MSNQSETEWSWLQIPAAPAGKKAFVADTPSPCSVPRWLLIIVLSATFFGLDADNQAAADHKRRDDNECVRQSGGTPRCPHASGHFRTNAEAVPAIAEDLVRTGSSCYESNDIPGATECIESEETGGWRVRTFGPLD